MIFLKQVKIKNRKEVKNPMALTSKKNNRKCIVCGHEYYFCNTCQDGAIKPAWYLIFHDQNCHDIYDAVANILPLKGKEAAKKALDKLDLSDKENFHQNIIKSINEIYDIVDEVVTQDNVDETKETKEVNEEVKETVENIETAKEVKDEIKSEEVKEDNTVKVVASSTEFANEVTNKTSNEVTKKTSTRSKSKK